MNPTGYAAALFYALAYLAMTFTCLLVVVKVASDGRNLSIAELAGLHRRSPLLAMALMVGVFSLGGIPRRSDSPASSWFSLQPWRGDISYWC